MPEHVTVEVPLDEAFVSVVRIIVSGVAERAELAFEDMDDLQLAVERLLAEAGTRGARFALVRAGRRATCAPASGRCASAASPRRCSAWTARRASSRCAWVLDTVVDSYGVEESSGDGIVVRLEKLVGEPA